MSRWLIFSLVWLCACASSKKIDSGPEAEAQSASWRHYDSDSKLSYQVTHDAQTLHLQLHTGSRSAIIRMLRRGLTIYFDETGKKNGDVYFQYPLPQVEAQLDRDSGPSGGPIAVSLKELVASLPDEAVFKRGETATPIALMAEDCDIRAEFTPGEGDLTYDLYMPFSRIVDGGPASLEKFSIGVVSGKFIVPSAPGPNAASTAAQGPTMPGRRTGAIPGRSQAGAGPSGPRNMSSLAAAIRLWFRVQFPEAG